MDIGIKNKYIIYQIFIDAAFAICVVLTVVFWICCYSDYNDKKMLENGIEVQAEIVDVREIDVRPDDPHNIERAWECIYLYVAPDGTRYSGIVGQFSQKQYADEHIGDKVTIVIDPTDGSSTYGTLASIAYWQKYSQTDLILACVFTGLLCITSYLFFYRVVYRDKLDKNILKKMRCSYVENIVVEGELVKVLGLLWFYVKVKYTDTKGTHAKWARSWFTRKEAKFLAQKKFVRIIPYKNTYGILEEMPSKKSQL